MQRHHGGLTVGGPGADDGDPRQPGSSRLGRHVCSRMASHLRIGQSARRRICSVTPVVRVRIHALRPGGCGRVRERREGLEVEVDRCGRCGDEEQCEDDADVPES